MVLRAYNLTKIFDAGTPAEVRAVEDLNIEVMKGEIVMLMGPSGSGKTTALTMLGGLLTPSSGSVVLQDKQISAMNARARAHIRRSSFGFIFQSFNLLENLSALENVSIAGFKLQHAKKRARELLARLGLESRMFAKPKELSGGERQRVAIARALMNDPLVVFADEPTANLDRKTGHEVMGLLCSVGCEQGKSIVVVSHDERIKDIAHNVFFMEDGKLVRTERGGHREACRMEQHFFQET